MKLLYIANLRLPTEKAYGVPVMQMCAAFQKAGAEVTLAVAKRKNPIREDAFAYYDVPHTFRLVYLPLLDWMRYGAAGHLATVLSFMVSAVRFARRERPDIIYTRDEFTAVALVAFFRNVVLEIHTKKRPTWYMRRAIRGASRIVFISHGLKRYYSDTFGIPERKVMVAPSGVDMERFRRTESKAELRTMLGLPQNAHIVGHIGKVTTMGEPKGVEELIDAFGSVRAKDKDALLLLVGVDEDARAALAARAHTAGIPEDSLRIVGHTPQRDLPPYFLVCDVLVMNYPDTDHYRNYMSPVKLFEYMASGVPIISTDLPSVREVAGDGGVYFVAPGSVSQVSECIRKVLSERPTFGRNHTLVAQNFSWQKWAGNILSYYPRQKRILYVVHASLNTPSRGTPIRMLNIARQLHQHFELTVCALDVNHNDGFSYLPYPDFKGFKKVLFFKRIIQQSNIDIVVTSTESGIRLPVVLKLFTRVSIVIDLHGLHAAELLLSKRLSRIGAALYKFRTKIYLRMYDLVLPVSDKLGSYYGQWIRHYFVVYGGAERVLPTCNQNKDSSVIRLGYMGNVRAYQGINELFIAMRTLIHEKGYNIKLQLVVSGIESTEMSDWLTKLELLEYVDFVCNVAHEKVMEYLNQADLLIIPRPSLEVTEYAFPSKLPEYLATGIYTITTDAGPIDELMLLANCKPYGIVSTKDTVGGICAEIESFLNKTVEERRKITDCAKRLLDNYLYWDKIGAKLALELNKIKNERRK